MSDEPEQLFREEASEFMARHRGPGELVRVSAAWTERAYWGLLALVAAGLAASLLLKIGEDPLLFVMVPALKTLTERLHA
jgi:hypothetical protein